MSYVLTELQLAILKVVWERGEATVLELHDALRKERRIAQSTVATLLTRMEKKGLVAHRVEGRQYVYRATVSERDVRRSMVAELTESLFQGRPADLISHLLSSREIAPGDLERVKELIEEKERAQGRRSGR